MVYLSEWFPNPPGNDNAGEFIELYNKSSAPANLNGWTLKTNKGKSFSLAGHTIAPNGYLVLKHTETKLSLVNTDGGLALYDASGKIIDRGNFVGAAPEGESYSRIDYGVSAAQHFAFVFPTPGVANKTISNQIAVRNYPLNVSLSRQLDGAQFLSIMIGTAALLAGLIIYIIHANQDISDILFGPNKSIGR